MCLTTCVFRRRGSLAQRTVYGIDSIIEDIYERLQLVDKMGFHEKLVVLLASHLGQTGSHCIN